MKSVLAYRRDRRSRLNRRQRAPRRQAKTLFTMLLILALPADHGDAARSSPRPFRKPEVGSPTWAGISESTARSLSYGRPSDSNVMAQRHPGEPACEPIRDGVAAFRTGCGQPPVVRSVDRMVGRLVDRSVVRSVMDSPPTSDRPSKPGRAAESQICAICPNSAENPPKRPGKRRKPRPIARSEPFAPSPNSAAWGPLSRAGASHGVRRVAGNRGEQSAGPVAGPDGCR
jgi:hypothetical protein